MTPRHPAWPDNRTKRNPCSTDWIGLAASDRLAQTARFVRISASERPVFCLSRHVTAAQVTANRYARNARNPPQGYAPHITQPWQVGHRRLPGFGQTRLFQRGAVFQDYRHDEVFFVIQMPVQEGAEGPLRFQ